MPRAWGCRAVSCHRRDRRNRGQEARRISTKLYEYFGTARLNWQSWFC